MTKSLAIGAGVLLVLLGVTGWLLKRSYEANGELKVAVSARDAVIRQKGEDALLSAKIIDKQQAALSALEQRAHTAITQVFREPTTTSCAQSPAMRAATRGLRDLFSGGAGGPEAGRQPPAALH